MIRAVGVAMLAFITFVLALLGLLAATGNLNAEALGKLAGQKTAEVAGEQQQPSVDELDPIARAIREREASLNQKEQELKSREAELEIQKADVESKLSELQSTLAQLQETLGSLTTTTDTDRQARLMDVATSLGKMKPTNAALAVEELDTETAVAVLRLVEEDPRGKILDKMKPEKAALVLRAMQEVSTPFPL